MSTFDLRTQPWILAHSLTGDTREYSLLELFSKAHHLDSLVGDLPTQVFALHRMLLAILHAALAPSVPSADSALTLWNELWQQEALPLDKIEAYLRDPVRDSRFDLFDAHAPFMQVAGLHTAQDEVSGLKRLIADVPNGSPYFTMRRGSGVARISSAEAARWLVHAHAFDTSGIKSGAVDDIRVKGGKGYPLGTGWAGEIGGLLAVGKTLRESLLLNFILVHNDAPVRVGVPVWDRRPLGPGIERLSNDEHNGDNGRERPDGVADLYTWPGRRIRLIEHEGEVTGVILAYGDPLLPQNAHVFEPLTTWRHSEPQSKKMGRQVFMPATHQPDRRLWRGLASLLPNARHSAPSAWLVEWIGLLADENALPLTASFNLRAIGASYGTQSAVIDEIIDDSITIRALLLSARDGSMADLALDALTTTEEAVTALARLAGDLEIARGGEPDGARSRARENAYFALDPLFRTWISALGTGPTEGTLSSWQSTARRALEEVARDLLAAAGPSAWVGRHRRTGGHASSSQAREWFRRSLRSALPGAYRVNETVSPAVRTEGVPHD
ncbi:type I-E CRISPR-associated protein Cse1/CasA [Rathayibacter toxicus]|uniref:type I-E CRISPR-associated protein Cse1/CasA n=1 Tax=Rathayibacter toxicus TaxID=145458 RepID=UPI000CE766CD|nr:type I-E CRISPR-associated protein Cse1/CasA [Rathayibacter toxicus]PPI56702.1 type I-E CRISPR-associated protein Cse1/CasA [Rathayibacter toxicus]QOD10539.1 type I-E CRISPR-associated protein Cse1/CasA [Rathayibacter toxicus]QWL27273.1 type I-E CRISPR-associated protein Cse1/CasA [Rathayibacter toxicus]